MHREGQRQRGEEQSETHFEVNLNRVPLAYACELENLQ